MYDAEIIRNKVGNLDNKPDADSTKVVLPSPKSVPNLTSSTLFPKADNGKTIEGDRSPYSSIFSSY